MTDLRALEAERLQLLRDWSNARPRSSQVAVGRSELGHECDAYLWHRTHGTPTINMDQHVLPSLRGVAFHALLEEILSADGWKVEHTVDADGMPGHVDAYRDGVVEDAKTGDSDKANALRLFGPDRAYRWQIHSYARALVAQGLPVHTVRIVVYATDLSEQIAVWQEAYDPNVAQEALDHLAEVAALPEPPYPSKDESWCRPYCRFFDDKMSGAGCPSRQLGASLEELTDPSQIAAAKELLEARKAVKEAQARRSAAAERLAGTVGLVDGFAVTQVTVQPSEVPDDDAIREAYGFVIGELPTKTKAGYSYVSIRKARKADL